LVEARPFVVRDAKERRVRAQDRHIAPVRRPLNDPPESVGGLVLPGGKRRSSCYMKGQSNQQSLMWINSIKTDASNLQGAAEKI